MTIRVTSDHPSTAAASVIFPVHRHILRQDTPHFDLLSTHEPHIERGTTGNTIISLRDPSPGVIHASLEYFYRDTFQPTADTAFLLMVYLYADHIDARGLKAHAASRLVDVVRARIEDDAYWCVELPGVVADIYTGTCQTGRHRDLRAGVVRVVLEAVWRGKGGNRYTLMPFLEVMGWCAGFAEEVRRRNYEALMKREFCMVCIRCGVKVGTVVSRNIDVMYRSRTRPCWACGAGMQMAVYVKEE